MDIKVYIKKCNECPFFESKNHFSTDGFDFMEDWHCKKAGKIIAGAVEWHEVSKIKIPDWCPAKV